MRHSHAEYSERNFDILCWFKSEWSFQVWLCCFSSQRIYAKANNNGTHTKRKSKQSTVIIDCSLACAHTQMNANDFIGSFRWASLNFKREWVSLANNYYSLFLDCVQPKTIINIIVIITSILSPSLLHSLSSPFIKPKFHITKSSKIN